MRVLFMVILLADVLSAQSVGQARTAVTRALPLLQRSAAEFVAKRACVSCHHNILPIMMLHLARERGVAIDQNVLTTVEDKTFRELRNPNALDDAIQAATINDPTPNDSFLLMAAHAAKLEPDPVTEIYARRLVSWQQSDHWITSDFRPPHSSSLFTTTASAVQAIRLYLPSERESILKAQKWLFETTPQSTEDAAFRLMGLVWAASSNEQVAAARRDLLVLQRTSGGWAQLPNYEPDAYSTGEALFALRESGVSNADAVFTRGIKFLISTQQSNGAWRVHTRMISPAEVSPPYFPTGFPYKEDEFLSYAGSCWAVMALLTALPEVEDRTQPVKSVVEAESWVRTALFGAPAELKTLLDSGLDPNSKTKNGTTLLMMAATNTEKVGMLLARGADAKARAASGCDALTVAAAYRGTGAAVKMLLDAGAEAKPPEGVRVRHRPLVLAAMSGDLENVQLLLGHVSDTNSEALSQAATFGHPDVVRALIASGADTKFTDSSGINLLHWATITDRPTIIPILIEAGVPIDDVDDAGYTPLMYAATIDFGNTDALKALLKGGADRTIRNLDGRTPLAQALHYKHAALAAALK